jgi:hypothetical protein
VNALVVAAIDIQRFLASPGWPNTVIGGLAVQRWGEPRQTRDVDLAVLTGIGREAELVDPMLARYRARRPDARDFALRYRVLLVETASGIPLDISLAALPFEERVVSRSTTFAFAPDHLVTTCSAEDLVVLKAFADRPQDWLDIEGIVVRQGAALDRSAILRELLPLLELKEDSAPKRLFGECSLDTREVEASERRAARAKRARRAATP